ncbi:hypothetical protein [Pseudomonas bohemica]|uniref:hypothetical protein n=1 Tax=Pseudomonas bohemica TaxID=2044872 RepID=UPI000DA606DD|nr:hypothetical protein [Pseudomonas bohemica]
MSDKKPFAWWVPISGETCFFKTYEEAKRERDAFEADFTEEDLAEGHYDPEPLFVAPAEDARAVGDEPVVYQVKIHGMTLYWNTPSEAAKAVNTPLYCHPQRPVVLPERRELSAAGRVYLSDLDCEWNACLDEFARLNP